VRRARVAVENLERLSHDDRIHRIEAPRRIKRQLAFSVPTVRADMTALTAAFPAPPPKTGSGVVIGIVDVGCDIAHPNVRNPDDTTRILHLWRQGAPRSPESPPDFGYGKAYDHVTIDAALAAGEPYGRLMGQVKPRPGSHGTHVMDIAAGNGRAAGTHPGVAPKADIIFVDVALDDDDGLLDLGSSAQLLDAVRYVFQKADALGRPAVVNVSLGANGGAHNGASLVDVGFEELLDRPGHAIVVAAGNAFEANCHTSGLIGPGQSRSLTWSVQPKDSTGNELEAWYVGGPLEAFLTAPGSHVELGPVRLDGEPGAFDLGGHFCRAYHKARDPAKGLNQIDIFLDWPPVEGDWTIRLANPGTAPASFDAWIERDDGNNNQSFFGKDVDTNRTLSTLACGARPIVVGSYGSGDEGRTVSSFSAAGPTQVQSQKPDVSAPGEFDATRGVQAACARTQGLTGFAGTSQAAPHVTGVVALMMEAAARPLAIDEIRQILIATARPAPNQALPWDGRAGAGRVDAVAAITAVLKL
jgi:subtilisin family serine protease